MIQKETKSRMEERRKALEVRFEKVFEKCTVNGWTCFACPNGSFFMVDYLVPYDALVLGYAENMDDINLNRFEDGDLFFLEDMDEEAMFQSMIEEIGQ